MPIQEEEFHPPSFPCASVGWLTVGMFQKPMQDVQLPWMLPPPFYVAALISGATALAALAINEKSSPKRNAFIRWRVRSSQTL